MRIISRPPGGLGNQLFSFLAALYFSQIVNVRIQIDLDNTDKKHGKETIAELVENLGILQVPHKADRFFSRRIRRFCQFRIEKFKVRFFRLFKHAFISDNSYMHLEESTKLTNEIFVGLLPMKPTRVTLDTYSQDFFYIDQLCKIKNCHPGEILGIGGYIQSGKSRDQYCTVHIRLGDALENKDSFGVLSQHYYLQNMQTLTEQQPGIKFEIFSDDILMARELYKCLEVFNIKWMTPEAERPPSAIRDLFRMTQNPNFILSNSTLAFWSAKLAVNVSRVIYPRPMYRKSRFDGVRSVPSDWVRSESSFL
jgi:hypothetical protein